MRNEREPTPVIARDYTEEDREMAVVSDIYNDVNFKRGWGDTGRRVQMVEDECPECHMAFMVRLTRVSPELPQRVKYWCLYPNCRHYLGDHLGWAMKNRYPHLTDPQEPAVTDA